MMKYIIYFYYILYIYIYICKSICIYFFLTASTSVLAAGWKSSAALLLVSWSLWCHGCAGNSAPSSCRTLWEGCLPKWRS